MEIWQRQQPKVIASMHILKAIEQQVLCLFMAEQLVLQLGVEPDQVHQEQQA